jgi:hypothetical protein
MKRYFMIIMMLMDVYSMDAQSISIQSGGSVWTESVPANTITQAGADYTTYVTSATNASLLNASPLILNYQVAVKRQDTLWDSRLQLYVRKTGDGTGTLSSVSPSGVGSYIQINTTNSNFFTGTLSRTGVPVQYEIRGISVLIPVRTYTTTITYTISGL